LRGGSAAVCQGELVDPVLFQCIRPSKSALDRVANPAEYLPDVIVELRGGWLKSRLHELLPDQWQAARDREREAARATT
jgi:hypothetical protein